ncbi:hypothetical protein KKE34_04305 [Patescibacteria group bacterium]|nr:hypothetical protein [Patescibacteria group bacterium]MBU1885801.1 hypothetical protein [Patescibacteria group bacterium]
MQQLVVRIPQQQKHILLDLAKIGRGTKGPKDLSSSYKQYLYKYVRPA